MTTPFWVLFAVALIPYALAGFGAYQRHAQLGVVDNNDWRTNQLPKLTGAGSRAYAAQANAWEAVAFFTAAVAVSHLGGADADAAATTSLVFLAARIAHAVCYLADLATLRTIVFLVGWGSCIRLFLLAA